MRFSGQHCYAFAVVFPERHVSCESGPLRSSRPVPARMDLKVSTLRCCFGSRQQSQHFQLD